MNKYQRQLARWEKVKSKVMNEVILLLLITKTWNEIHTIIPINNNNMAYDIWVNVKKETLINILKSFH